MRIISHTLSASLLCFVFLSGCAKDASDDGGDDTSTPDVTDQDNDGFSVEDGDCNDHDNDVYPGAGDTYGDDADQNCDGIDGVDADGDGWASEASGGEDCDDTDASLESADADGDGYSTCDGDCNDAAADFFPTDSDGDGVEDFCGWIDLSAGDLHTCGVKSSGSVECWGYDAYGQVTDTPTGP